MSWVETSAGHLQRPLDGAESGMIFAITVERHLSREPVRIHAFADFVVKTYDRQTTLTSLKDAWKALRLLKSPDIATTYADGHSHYQVPSASELEEWLDLTFRVAPIDTSAQTIVREMQLKQEMMPVLYILPKSSDSTSNAGFRGTAILFISHWRTEAAGAFKLVSHVFDFASDLLSGTSTRNALSKHRLGDETKLLCPTIQDILMPDKSSSPDSKIRVQKIFAEYDSKLPTVNFPMQGDAASLPASVKLNRRTYSERTTSELWSTCKANNISVTSAIHSAYLTAIWQQADAGQKSRNYASMMPAQVRTRLPQSSPYRDQGGWNASQMLMLTAPVGQDFLTRARGFKQQYSLADQPTWLYEDAREMSEQLIKHPLNLESSLPWITSHGVLDREIIPSGHGELEIEDVMVFADPVLGPGIVLGLWTFRDRLNIEIHWNSAYYSDGTMNETLDIIDETLVRELGVPVEANESTLVEF